MVLEKQIPTKQNQTGARGGKNALQLKCSLYLASGIVGL